MWAFLRSEAGRREVAVEVEEVHGVGEMVWSEVSIPVGAMALEAGARRVSSAAGQQVLAEVHGSVKVAVSW